MLCDSLGLPCSLVRGEYGRHWNEVSIGQDISPKPETSPNTHDQDSSLNTPNKDPTIPTLQKDPISTPQSDTISGLQMSSATPDHQAYAKESTSNPSKNNSSNHPHKEDTSTDSSQDQQDKDTSPKESKSDSQTIHQPFLVDLMFNPGELLPSNSPQALQYQHVI